MEKQDNAAVKPMAKDLATSPIEVLRNEFLGGISWFYWIGGLSLVNMAFGVFANRKFIVGLGITEFFDAFAFGGNGVSLVWLAASVAVSAIFILLGFMGRKGKKSYILGGLAFYALDAALLVFAEDFLGVAFHAYAGFMIFKGYQALGKILSAATPGPATEVESRDKISRTE